LQGDHAVKAAVAELLQDGEVQRHVRRVRRVYQRRRDLLADLLRRTASDALSFTVPAGGVALCVGIRKGLNVERWAAAAMKRGVAFQTARAFTFDRRPQPFARLGFAAMNEGELREATARLVAALAAA
jgi:GntR family transcriptional regulator/MocR family aminotransferase